MTDRDLAENMAQGIKHVLSKPNSLSSIPQKPLGKQTEAESPTPQSCLLIVTSKQRHMCAHIPTHTGDDNTNNTIKFNKVSGL